MIPTTLILTSTFVLLLLPVGNTRDLSIKKEKEVKNYTTVSIGLHIRPTHKNSGSNPEITQIVHPGLTKTDLELPSEQFTETSLQMEEWMKSPKNWNKNKD